MAESPREEMPDRRETWTMDFEHEGVEYAASIGYFSDGRVSEIFVSGGKPGSAVSIMSNEASIIASVALQFGAPLKTIKSALPKLKDGRPAGPLGVALKLLEDSLKERNKLQEALLVPKS